MNLLAKNTKNLLGTMSREPTGGVVRMDGVAERVSANTVSKSTHQ